MRGIDWPHPAGIGALYSSVTGDDPGGEPDRGGGELSEYLGRPAYFLLHAESDVPAYAEDEPEVFYIHQSGGCDYPDDL